MAQANEMKNWISADGEKPGGRLVHVFILGGLMLIGFGKSLRVDGASARPSEAPVVKLSHYEVTSDWAPIANG